MPGGLKGLGLARLAKSRVTREGTIPTTVQAMRDQESPSWAAAADILEVRASDFASALAIFASARHAHVSREEVQAALAAHRSKLDPLAPLLPPAPVPAPPPSTTKHRHRKPRKKSKQNRKNKNKNRRLRRKQKRSETTFSGIELRFRGDRQQLPVLPVPTLAQSIAYSSHPVKTGNLDLARKRHPAWQYDFDTPEVTRHGMLRPHLEPAWRDGLDNKQGMRAERLRLMDLEPGDDEEVDEGAAQPLSQAEMQAQHEAAEVEDAAIEDAAIQGNGAADDAGSDSDSDSDYDPDSSSDSE
ncbi:hypothetical protein EMMF5_006604, partial [Cystobasidiomycetes sp. EMM_F5]